MKKSNLLVTLATAAVIAAMGTSAQAAELHIYAWSGELP